MRCVCVYESHILERIRRVQRRRSHLWVTTINIVPNHITNTNNVALGVKNAHNSADNDAELVEEEVVKEVLFGCLITCLARYLCLFMPSQVKKTSTSIYAKYALTLQCAKLYRCHVLHKNII